MSQKSQQEFSLKCIAFYRRLCSCTILNIHVSRNGLLSLYFQVMLRRLSHVFNNEGEEEEYDDNDKKIRVQLGDETEALTEEQKHQGSGKGMHLVRSSLEKLHVIPHHKEALQDKEESIEEEYDSSSFDSKENEPKNIYSKESVKEYQGINKHHHYANLVPHNNNNNQKEKLEELKKRDKDRNKIRMAEMKKKQKAAEKWKKAYEKAKKKSREDLKREKKKEKEDGQHMGKERGLMLTEDHQETSSTIPEGVMVNLKIRVSAAQRTVDDTKNLQNAETPSQRKLSGFSKWRKMSLTNASAGTPSNMSCSLISSQTQTDYVMSVAPAELTEIIKQRLKKHELVIARREKEHEVRFMKAKLSHHQLVLHKLYEDYQDSAGQCPCCRYPEMKELILTAIENYHDKDFEKRYASGDDPVAEFLGDIENAVSTVRRMSIATNAMNMFRMNEDELVDNMMEMEDELNAYQRAVVSEERKISKMIQSYNKLHEVNIFRRYCALMDIIEEACMDCVTEEMMDEDECSHDS